MPATQLVQAASAEAVQAVLREEPVVQFVHQAQGAVPEADQATIGDLILKKKVFVVRYKASATFADGVTNGTAAFHVKVRIHTVVTPGL